VNVAQLGDRRRLDDSPAGLLKHHVRYTPGPHRRSRSDPGCTLILHQCYGNRKHHDPEQLMMPATP
jgi:hypothetical protein